MYKGSRQWKVGKQKSLFGFKLFNISNIRDRLLYCTLKRKYMKFSWKEELSKLL